MVPVRFYFALAGVLALYLAGLMTGCRIGKARLAKAQDEVAALKEARAEAFARYEALTGQLTAISKRAEADAVAAEARAEDERRRGRATLAAVRAIPSGADCAVTARAAAATAPALAAQWRGDK